MHTEVLNRTFILNGGGGGGNPRESKAFICDRYIRKEPGILKPQRN